MKGQKFAVLLTCHNRKSKTLACLSSLFEAKLPSNYEFDVFLTDDGSTDGTYEAVREKYPHIHTIKGSGNLFWAGGMRLAWKTAKQQEDYDAYLLLNDDVVLHPDFLHNLIKTEEFSIAKTGKTGIYSGATIDEDTQKVTYGGSKIKTNHFVLKMDMLSPDTTPKECEITNANVLWISKEVVNKIGIFDDKYTHGIADYDYSYQAHKNEFPVYLAPNICGTCSDDHGKNWRKGNVPLKARIAYLKSPKGLAYSEYLYYIRKNFPMFLPYSFTMLWLKTFFPFIWDRFKS